jgi:hypothetical protein
MVEMEEEEHEPFWFPGFDNGVLKSMCLEKAGSIPGDGAMKGCVVLRFWFIW